MRLGVRIAHAIDCGCDAGYGYIGVELNGA